MNYISYQALERTRERLRLRLVISECVKQWHWDITGATIIEKSKINDPGSKEAKRTPAEGEVNSQTP